MTLRYSIVDLRADTLRRLHRLWWAGRGRCVVCGGRIAEPIADHLAIKGIDQGPRATEDHVVPRRPNYAGLAACRAWRKFIGYGTPVSAPAHATCNNHKSNRPPTGCEVVFLLAVNARLNSAPVRRG